MSNAVYTQNHCSTRMLNSMTPEKTWSERVPYIADMRIFICIAYAMVSDEKMGKLNVKDIKYLFIGNYEGTKSYRLIYLQIKK